MKRKLKFIIPLCLILVWSVGFSNTPNYIKEVDGVTSFSYTDFISYMVAMVSKGANEVLEMSIPLLGGLVLTDYFLNISKVYSQGIKEIFVKSIDLFLKYGTVAFFVFNWFGGLQISANVINVVTNLLPRAILADSTIEQSQVLNVIMNAIMNNAIYLMVAPMKMLENADMLRLLMFFILANLYVLCLFAFLICGTLIVAEIFTESMNVIIVVSLSFMMFIVGVVQGFSDKLFIPLFGTINAFIKFMCTYFIFGTLWNLLRPHIESIAYVDAQNTEFSIAYVLKVVTCAALSILFYIVYKYIMNFIGNTLQQLR